MLSTLSLFVYLCLCTAVRRQTAARESRRHLLCGAAEGLLCVRMPCITRDCFHAEDRGSLASGFLCGSRECACPFTPELRQEEDGCLPNSTIPRKGRRGQNRAGPPSQDLLVRFLQLFRELRWGEAIHARVRRQLTQVQGCLLALQRLQAEASAESDGRIRGTVTVADILRKNTQWTDTRNRGAASLREAEESEALPLLSQADLEQ